jgi:ABC-type sugar transport system ATPase subunit
MMKSPGNVMNSLPDDGHFPADTNHPEVVLNFSNAADATSPQNHLVKPPLTPTTPGSSFSFPVPSNAGHAGPAIMGIRPEAASLGNPADSSTRATVDRVERLGGETLIHLRSVAGRQVLRAEPREALPSAGDIVGLLVDPRRALFFDANGERIRLA